MSCVLPFVWYPLVITAALAAFFTLLGQGAAPAVAAYVPAIVAGVSILLLERRYNERDEWRPGKSDLVGDAAFMGLVMVALPRLLMFLAILAFTQDLHARNASVWWPHDWPLWAQMIAMVLAVDLLRYWLHRACHHFTPLWRLHEVHHSPDILYVMNVGRFHPIEKVLHFALDTVPFLLLGVAADVLAGYFLLYSVNGFFQHSNLKLRYGWLNYLVGSAETHRWHHARDPAAASCNFGSTTAVWDVVFGTWRLPGPVGEIGIVDREYPKGFLAQMAMPFRRRGARVRRSVRRWLADKLVAARLRLAQYAACRRLARNTRDPMRVQREVLTRIVERNRDTTFGREHGFARISGLAYDAPWDIHAAFAHAVPAADFERLRRFIDDEVARGEAALTAERPLRYLRTSGTTAAPKDIPLTPSHLKALRRIHRDSVAFQHRVCPEAFGGGIVAMVSPALEGTLANGKPFGSASGIVAGNTPVWVQEKFVVPAAVMTVPESRVKYLLALRIAVARADVTYLGAANPSTLLAMTRLYREHHAQLIDDVRKGTFFLASRVPADVMKGVRARLGADRERAEQLSRLHAANREVRIADLFPALRLVVTWTCASAGVAADALRKELASRVRIMELGYISSEFRGTVTIGRRAGCGLPTLDTHYFEFVERDLWDAGTPEYLALDRVRKGRDYYLIVTTPSGLYRYFINDIVRVTGFLNRTPLLKFVQKGKGVTSITGEKLYEAQALQAVRESMAAMGRAARFVMMLADEVARKYRLYVEPDAGPALDAAALARATDRRLVQRNSEYGAKRESERLAPLEAHWLAPETGDAYKQHCVKRGQREGQFKMVSLEYLRKFTFDLDAHALAR